MTTCVVCYYINQSESSLECLNMFERHGRPLKPIDSIDFHRLVRHRILRSYPSCEIRVYVRIALGWCGTNLLGSSHPATGHGVQESSRHEGPVSAWFMHRCFHPYRNDHILMSIHFCSELACHHQIYRHDRSVN